jgi:MYND finger
MGKQNRRRRNAGKVRNNKSACDMRTEIIPGVEICAYLSTFSPTQMVKDVEEGHHVATRALLKLDDEQHEKLLKAGIVDALIVHLKEMGQPSFAAYCSGLKGSRGTIVDTSSTTVFQHSPLVWLRALWFLTYPTADVSTAVRETYIFGVIAQPDNLLPILEIMNNCSSGRLFGDREQYLVGILYWWDVLKRTVTVSKKGQESINMKSRLEIIRWSIQLLSAHLPQNKAFLKGWTMCLQRDIDTGCNLYALSSEMDNALEMILSTQSTLGSVTGWVMNLQLRLNPIEKPVIENPESTDFLRCLARIPTDKTAGTVATTLVDICIACQDQAYEEDGVDGLITVLNRISMIVDEDFCKDLSQVMSLRILNITKLINLLESHRVQFYYHKLAGHILYAIYSFSIFRVPCSCDDVCHGCSAKGVSKDSVTAAALNGNILQCIMRFLSRNPEDSVFLRSSVGYLDLLISTADRPRTSVALCMVEGCIRPLLGNINNTRITRQIVELFAKRLEIDVEESKANMMSSVSNSNGKCINRVQCDKSEADHMDINNTAPSPTHLSPNPNTPREKRLDKITTGTSVTGMVEMYIPSGGSDQEEKPRKLGAAVTSANATKKDFDDKTISLGGVAEEISLKKEKQIREITFREYKSLMTSYLSNLDNQPASKMVADVAEGHYIATDCIFQLSPSRLEKIIKAGLVEALVGHLAYSQSCTFVKYCRTLPGEYSTLSAPVAGNFDQHRPIIWLEALHFIAQPEYHPSASSHEAVILEIANPANLMRFLPLLRTHKSLFRNPQAYFIGVPFLMDMMDGILTFDAAAKLLDQPAQDCLLLMTIEFLKMTLPQESNHLHEFANAYEQLFRRGARFRGLSWTMESLGHFQNSLASILKRLVTLQDPEQKKGRRVAPGAPSNGKMTNGRYHFVRSMAIVPIDCECTAFGTAVIDVCRFCDIDAILRGVVKDLLFVINEIIEVIAHMCNESVTHLHSFVPSNILPISAQKLVKLLQCRNVLFWKESDLSMEVINSICKALVSAATTQESQRVHDATGASLVVAGVLETMLFYRRKKDTRSDSEFAAICHKFVQLLRKLVFSRRTNIALRFVVPSVRPLLVSGDSVSSSISQILCEAEKGPLPWTEFKEPLTPKEYCAHCHKKRRNPMENKIACGKCHRAWYCSVECRKFDWECGGHQFFCEYFVRRSQRFSHKYSVERLFDLNFARMVTVASLHGLHILDSIFFVSFGDADPNFEVTQADILQELDAFSNVQSRCESILSSGSLAIVGVSGPAVHIFPVGPERAIALLETLGVDPCSHEMPVSIWTVLQMAVDTRFEKTKTDLPVPFTHLKATVEY